MKEVLSISSRLLAAGPRPPAELVAELQACPEADLLAAWRAWLDEAARSPDLLEGFGIANRIVAMYGTHPAPSDALSALVLRAGVFHDPGRPTPEFVDLVVRKAGMVFALRQYVALFTERTDDAGRAAVVDAAGSTYRKDSATALSREITREEVSLRRQLYHLMMDAFLRGDERAAPHSMRSIAGYLSVIHGWLAGQAEFAPVIEQVRRKALASADPYVRYCGQVMSPGPVPPAVEKPKRPGSSA